MEQQIILRFNDEILKEAMQRYGIAKNQIKLLDSFESFIYKFERGGNGYILRIGHSIRKSEALINGEVDWINYLAHGGVSVAQAIPSDNDKLVESIDDGQGGQFLVTAFIRAEGQSPWKAGWTIERYETYGELLGKMHSLAMDYEPIPANRRPEWDDVSMNCIELFLPESEVIVHQKYQSLLKHINDLPKDKYSYGLIHGDAHQNNFFIDANGVLTIFDFDDCVYSWFVNDIAIVLFYISMDAQEFGYPTVNAFTKEFMTHFLRGYDRFHTLEAIWLKEIPYFLKLRELELYSVIYRDFDIKEVEHWSPEVLIRSAGFDPKNGSHMWIANFMRDRKQKIEQGVSFIDFDFENPGT